MHRLIVAIIVFTWFFTGSLAWARYGHHYQRPISHSNHAALLRYYSTPYQLRPPVRHFDSTQHHKHRHRNSFHRTDHHQKHHQDSFDVFIRWRH